MPSHFDKMVWVGFAATCTDLRCLICWYQYSQLLHLFFELYRVFFRTLDGRIPIASVTGCCQLKLGKYGTCYPVNWLDMGLVG
ncbi:hypothetical protein Pfo_031053 [Paulownia fortunei]|nr:hypothetical protein Pfo_031053 [Paulownia fortunei]